MCVSFDAIILSCEGEVVSPSGMCLRNRGNGKWVCLFFFCVSVLFKILYSNVSVIIIEFVVVKCSALCVEFQ